MGKFQEWVTARPRAVTGASGAPRSPARSHTRHISCRLALSLPLPPRSLKPYARGRSSVYVVTAVFPEEFHAYAEVFYQHSVLCTTTASCDCILCAGYMGQMNNRK